MKMRPTLVCLAVAGAVAATVLPNVAGASNGRPELVGWAGGTVVTALDGTVTSDMTAPSSINSSAAGATNSNSVGNVSVSNLIAGAAVTTSESTVSVAGGIEIVSRAKTTGLSLLGGLISASAVDTTSVARLVNGAVTSTISTTFVGLKVSGVQLPLTIPKNFGATIPGVASIVFNAAYSVPGDATIRTDAAGMYVSLLQSRGPNSAGTEITLNPVHAEVGVSAPLDASPVGGMGYGTKVSAAATDQVRVNSGPTAYNVMAGGGTSGIDRVNATGGVNIPGVATAGAAKTIANGTALPTGSNATMTVEITGVNLFGGLIRADLLKGVAHASKLPGKPVALSESTSLVHLVIAGKAIPLNVSPNTVINVAGLGKVTINQQLEVGTYCMARLLDIKLSTAGFGLAGGAEVEVGTAIAYIG